MRMVSDIIISWVPRELKTMPALTTNIEFGEDLWTGKILYGRPDDAEKCRYLDKRWFEITNKEPFNSLEEILTEAINLLQNSIERTGIKKIVPSMNFGLDSFNNWFHHHEKNIENIQTILNINSAETIEYNKFKIPNLYPTEKPFLNISRVRMKIENENRIKSNEIIISRPDINVIVPIYYNKKKNIKLLLVNEFRVNVLNEKNYVKECPSGSSNTKRVGLDSAIEEMKEETGLEIAKERCIYVDSKQSFATLLTHKTHIWYVQLTKEEYKNIKKSIKEKKIFGIDAEDNNTENSGEKIHLSIVENKNIYKENIDLNTLGIINSAIQKFLNYNKI